MEIYKETGVGDVSPLICPCGCALICAASGNFSGNLSRISSPQYRP